MEVIFEFCEDLRGNENNNSIITFTGNGLTYYMLCIEWMMSYVLLSAIRMKLLDSMQKLQVGLLRPFERSYRNMRSVTTSSSRGLALLMCEMEVVTFSPDVHAIWPNTMLSCTVAFHMSARAILGGRGRGAASQEVLSSRSSLPWLFSPKRRRLYN